MLAHILARALRRPLAAAAAARRPFSGPAGGAFVLMTERCAVKIKDHYARAAAASARNEDTARIADAENGKSAGGRRGLRVLVDQGGCSGFEYKLSFDEEKEDDEVFSKNGAHLLIDTVSLPFLDGSTIDFAEQDLISTGFLVASNPNADSVCGCNTSFSPKDML